MHCVILVRGNSLNLSKVILWILSLTVLLYCQHKYSITLQQEYCLKMINKLRLDLSLLYLHMTEVTN